MRLGVSDIFPKDYRQITAERIASLRADGFQSTLIFFPDPIAALADGLKALPEMLRDEGLPIAMVNGTYPVLVDPDSQQRAAGVKAAGALCDLALQLDTKIVYIRPGGLNPRGPWWPHPENHSPATFDRLADSMRQLARHAADCGVTLAIEGHVLCPLSTPERIRDLLDVVGSPALKFNVDPVNFIGTVADVYDSSIILNKLFDLLGPDIVCAHAKDVQLGESLVLHIEEAVPGTGHLDYRLYLQRLLSSAPNADLVIEHIPRQDALQAQASITTVATAIGITFQ